MAEEQALALKACAFGAWRWCCSWVQVDESLEVEVLNLKYDLSLLTEAIKASQKAQAGNDVVRTPALPSCGQCSDGASALPPRGPRTAMP